MSRHAELAHQEHVERRAQGRRDLEGHRHAATRQSEDHDVLATRVLAQALRQKPASLRPIAEARRCRRHHAQSACRLAGQSYFFTTVGRSTAQASRNPTLLTECRRELGREPPPRVVSNGRARPAVHSEVSRQAASVVIR